ncbi:unnamed protein product [Arctia plantaginis]|uniref:Uncharacterized protein n=1 Tax=Arctia plantaginis TaxID=874455 RepID=A0A8S1AKJ3_ARCPL|nr:unnamed protein product [Arctia plantaginis]
MPKDQSVNRGNPSDDIKSLEKVVPLVSCLSTKNEQLCQVLAVALVKAQTTSTLIFRGTISSPGPAPPSAESTAHAWANGLVSSHVKSNIILLRALTSLHLWSAIFASARSSYSLRFMLILFVVPQISAARPGDSTTLLRRHVDDDVFGYAAPSHQASPDPGRGVPCGGLRTDGTI